MRISWGSDSVGLNAAAIEDTIQGLVSDQPYSFRVMVRDLHGNWSYPESVSVMTLDTIRPQPVTGLTVVPGPLNALSLTWNPSTSNDADSVRIILRTDRLPLSALDSVAVANLLASQTADTIVALRYATQYWISLFVKDSAGNWSLADSASSDSATTPDSLINMTPVLTGWDTLTEPDFMRYRDGSGNMLFRYAVSDSSDSTVHLRFEYRNGGAWALAQEVSGDTGFVEAQNSVQHQILFSARATFGSVDTLIDFRLIADDGQGLVGQDTAFFDSVRVDTRSPVGQALSIRDSSGYINHPLPLLDISASGADSMGIALSGTDRLTVPFVPFSSTVVCPSLETEGLRQVYVWFKDSLGNGDTVALTDSTILDTTLPVVQIVGLPNQGRPLKGRTQTIRWLASDSHLTPIGTCLSIKIGEGNWQILKDSAVDSGSMAWTVPVGPDSLYSIKLTVTDLASNRSETLVSMVAVDAPGQPVRFEVYPAKVTMTTDSILDFSILAVDADSNPIADTLLIWAVVGGAGTMNSRGHFTPRSAGLFFVTAEYLGVRDTTDSIVVKIESALDSGIHEVTPYLTIEVPFRLSGARLKLAESDPSSKVALNGMVACSPLLDFGGSTPPKYSSPVMLAFSLDSLNLKGKPVSSVRIFRFNDSAKGWEVVFNALPDSLNKIRWMTDTLVPLMVAVDTLPPTVVNLTDTLKSEMAGASLIIRGLTQDNVVNKTTKFYYRKGGAASFDSLSITDSTNGHFAVTLPLTERGLEYFTRSNDGSYSVRSISAQIRTTVVNLEKSGTFTSGQWKMISVPARAKNDSLNRFFRLLGDYKYDWRLYRWTGSEYVESGSNPSERLVSGESYWLKTLKSGFVPKLDTGEGLPVNRCFERVLLPHSWTAIGNPYPYPVSWKSILDSTRSDSLSGPYTYSDTNWIPPLPNFRSVLNPWEGYYVRNMTSHPLVIRIPSIEALAPLARTALCPMDSLSFELDWEVTGPAGRDFRNYCGALSRVSTSGYDAGLDAVAPPEGPDKGFSANFIRNDYGPEFRRLAVDYGDLADGGESFTLRVSGLGSDATYVSILRGIEKLSPSLKAVIVDRTRKVFAPLTSNGFEFTASEGEAFRDLEVMVGSEAFVNSRMAGLSALPLFTELAQNFPDPFNPVTTIPFAIAGKGKAKVLLSIFDIRGRVVRTLIHDTREAGYYKAVWDGKNRVGQPVGSGIYFTRLFVGAHYQKTLKMVLVR